MIDEDGLIQASIELLAYWEPYDGYYGCFSGGKDSMSLLHLLIGQERFFPVNFSIGAVHVISDFDPNPGKTKAYLKDMCKSRGIPCGFVEISVTTDKEGDECEPSCFWCSRYQTLFRNSPLFPPRGWGLTLCSRIQG